MGWFDSQVEERKQKDTADLEDAFAEIANAVSGKRLMTVYSDEGTRLMDSINAIIEYWKLKPVEVNGTAEDMNEQLEYMLRPHGIMYRDVELKKGWYKTAYGPMLGRLKETGAAVALLPNKVSGYRYYDESAGKYKRVGKRNEDLLEADAICFYRPLPQRKLGLGDCILYVLGTFTAADILIPAALLAAAALVGLLIPKMNYFMFSTVVQNGNPELWLSTAVFMLSLAVSQLMLKTVQSTAVSRVDMKMSVSVQSALMMRLLSLPAGFFSQYSSGELYSRITNVSTVCRSVLESVVTVIFTALFSLVYITQIVRFSPPLVIPSLLILFSTLIVSILTAVLQSAFGSRRMQAETKESGLLYATIAGIRKIKLAGAEKRAFARWARLYARRLRHPPALVKFSTVINTAITLIGNIVIYFLAVENRVGVADYYAFHTAYSMISGAFAALSAAAVSAAGGRTVFDMVKPILDTAPENAGKKRLDVRLKGNIELNNVSFRYRDDMPNVIDNLSLKIRAGEYTAIVGKTGCGKSTLLRLLLGFERPQKGAVYYDGRDLSMIDLKSLRRQIGSVMQNGRLFAGSLFSNITLSAPWLSQEDAWEAAEIAGIAEDIRQMPMGMNTLVSENSGGFSGGQRQRLLIARAIAPKPKILIFDEATSALDNITQRRISDALDRMKCTRIVVAHRLSTIKDCDRILVLDAGRVAEEGSYDELIARGGIFAALVANQRIDRENGERRRRGRALRVMAAVDEQFPMALLTQAVDEALPGAELLVFHSTEQALACARERKIDAAFLDADLCPPGGGELARLLREQTSEIFLLTDREEREGRPSDTWLMQPLTLRSLRRELEHLAGRTGDAGILLYVQCFGNFDVFQTDRTRLHFKRKKSKELFAYLIYRRGAACGNAEIASVIFDDDDYDLKRQQYLQKIIASLLETLAEAHAEKVILRSYGSISVDVNRVQCDYYRFTESDTEVLKTWAGEFMMQYSWAEPVAGYISGAVEKTE